MKPRANGFTIIPNELIDSLAKVNIPGESMRVLWVIFRLTYGWKKDSAVIEHSRLSNATGIKRPNIFRALKKLQIMNIIRIQMATKNTATYSVNSDCKSWRLQPLCIQTDTAPCIQTDTKAYPNGYKSVSKRIQKRIQTDTEKPLQPAHSAASSVPKERKKLNKINKSLKSANADEGREKFSDKRDWPDDCWQMQYAKRFASRVRDSNLHPENPSAVKKEEKAGFANWCETLDKLNRIDGKTTERIAQVIRFALEDEFWAPNLLSLSSLRKKGRNGVLKFENIEARLIASGEVQKVRPGLNEDDLQRLADFRKKAEDKCKMEREEMDKEKSNEEEDPFAVLKQKAASGIPS